MLSDRSGSWHLVKPKDVILSKTICLNDNNNRTSSAAAEKVNSNTSYYLVMSHAKKATEVYRSLHHYKCIHCLKYTLIKLSPCCLS